ncbi:hypothetical protein Dda_7335 [Drechslerella dactyloides]|uniref:Uncharacterized protein n=1 Tax=Drechslerella dactyloides TaxID=74499 RepID=A0AAD6ITV1_DREDA|nr:hypothetical protein Dda_7335 [Drechslerella dactyloides]
MFSRFALAAVFTTSALSAALPTAKVNNGMCNSSGKTFTTVSFRGLTPVANKSRMTSADLVVTQNPPDELVDYFEVLEIFETSAVNPLSNLTTADLDNAWTPIDLQFPFQVYNKTSSKAFISINGYITLDEPSTSKLPGDYKPFPVNPADCSVSTSKDGCPPATIMAVLWAHLGTTPTYSGFRAAWTYAVPSSKGTPHFGPSYNFQWNVCDLSALAANATADESCSDESRFLQLTYFKERPGVWHMAYADGRGEQNIKATVGVQSYPDFLQGTYPPPTQVEDSGKQSCLIFDTNTNTVSLPPEEDRSKPNCNWGKQY